LQHNGLDDVCAKASAHGHAKACDVKAQGGALFKCVMRRPLALGFVRRGMNAARTGSGDN
jgi:hypothetical protein